MKKFQIEIKDFDDYDITGRINTDIHLMFDDGTSRNNKKTIKDCPLTIKCVLNSLKALKRDVKYPISILPLSWSRLNCSIGFCKSTDSDVMIYARFRNFILNSGETTDKDTMEFFKSLLKQRTFDWDNDLYPHLKEWIDARKEPEKCSIEEYKKDRKQLKSWIKHLEKLEKRNRKNYEREQKKLNEWIDQQRYIHLSLVSSAQYNSFEVEIPINDYIDEIERFVIEVYKLKGKNENPKISEMLKIIKNLCVEEGFADIQDVLDESEKQGISKDKAKEILKKLQREGEIYEHISNKFKVTHAW